MKTIRKGSDIVVRWRIFRYGQEYDIALYRESISLVLSNMGEKKEITDYSIVDVNTIVFKYRAEDQGLGIYRLLLIDKSRNSTRIIEECNAFRLVNTSDAANNDDTLESAITITLTSELTAPADGLSAYEVALQNGFIGTEEEWLQSLVPDTTDIELAEAQRQANELSRIESEETRQNQESTRLLNEQERQEAEQLRKTSESNRSLAEDTRNVSEQERNVNETSRMSAEEARNEKEQERQSAELNRQNSESERQSNELERIESENARQSAEVERQQASTEAISSTNVAATNASNAATNANNAAATANNAATTAQQKAEEANAAASAANGAASSANAVVDAFNSIIVQETGNAQDKVMSQKAVTDVMTASQAKLSELVNGREINLLKLTTITQGERISLSGYILSDANFWRTDSIPVEENEILTSVSKTLSILFNFYFYNDLGISTSKFVSFAQGRKVTVPTGAKYVVITNKINDNPANTSIVCNRQDIVAEFPTIGMNTIIGGMYSKDDIDTIVSTLATDEELGKANDNIQKLESETRVSLTPYTDNFAMVNESGDILERGGYVISDFIEVSENDTLTWSSGISNVDAFAYLAQYDADKNITSSVWVSIPTIREIPVREGTKYVRASFKKSSDIYLKDGKGNYLFAYNDISKALQNIGITTDGEHEILPSSYAEEVGYRTSQQYVNLRWTPKFPVPRQGGANYFPANEERQGILYAEGAYQDKRVGYDVSLKTFMTAINNPYSLIYTENCAASYSKSAYGVQYKGDANSGAYMGFVCNNFVFYTLGEKIPYSSVEIATWCVEKGLTEKIYDQSSHGLKLMDILQISGHCQVVTRLWANSRNVVTKVQVSEAVGSGSRNVIFTAKQFDVWLKSSGYAIYRYRDLYKNIYYEKSPFIAVEDEVVETYEYNNDICTFAGDYASFGEGSLLHINYTKGNYNIMEIYKNDILIESIALSSDENVDLTNKGYTYGKYKARLTNGTEHSDYTYFEILNVELSKSGNLFTFSSANAKPIYWGWFAMNGWAFQKHILTESDLAKGSVDYSQYQTSDGHPYLKIYVQGEYGRIAKIVE